MHISSQMNHYLNPHESSKLSTSSLGPLHFDTSAHLPDKHPPLKATQSRTNINSVPQTSESYDGVKFPNNISYQKSHERFGTQGTQATFDDSLSIGQSKEQRWFSQWSRDQMDSKEIPQTGVGGPLPSYLEEKRTSKTLPIFLGAHETNEKKEASKSHVRTFSSTYGMKENYPANISNLPQDFVSPRLYSNKGELFSFKGRKRVGRRKGLHETASLRQTLDNENPQAEESSVERLYMTEQLHPYDLFSPKMDEMELENETKSRSRRKKKYEERSLGATELSLEAKRHRGKDKENETSKHTGNSSKHWEISKSRGKNKYGEVESEDYRRNKSFREPKESRRHFESKEYDTMYNDNHYEKQIREMKEKDAQLKQMKKFYEQLYDNYVEVKGGLETIVEEKEKLLNNLNFHISQNETLKDKLTEAHKKETSLIEENQQLKQNQMKRDELINTLETQVGKLKTEVAVWTKRYDDQSESYNSKLKRIERERHDLLDKKERLEKSVEEYINHHEQTDREDKVILAKHLEERTRQVKALKRKNEELVQEIEKLNKVHNESLERQYTTERLRSTLGKLDTKKLFEETFNQTKGDKSQDLIAEIRKYKTETERLRAENESLKHEAYGRQTLRRFEELDSSIERLDERSGSLEKKKKSTKKSSESGALGKVLREIINETGVDNIHEVTLKIKELQEGHKTNAKFVSGVLDLIYKCSPPGFFEGKPTVKQAWNWLKRFMEEYMAMKKRIKAEDDFSVEKEIIDSLMECLKISEKDELVPKVRHIESENSQMKKALEKAKASGLESSFGLMEDKYKNSYGHYGYLHSTARFENQYSLTGKLQ